jgi:hypothetical protein
MGFRVVGGQRGERKEFQKLLDRSGLFSFQEVIHLTALPPPRGVEPIAASNAVIDSPTCPL